MAWLEFTGGAFRISYRFGSRKHHRALKTADRREATTTLGRFDSNVRLIEQGAIAPPPPGAALGTYIVSGGKLGNRPSQTARIELHTLASLFDDYLAAYPKGRRKPQPGRRNASTSAISAGCSIRRRSWTT
jgi:hypothetical protein